MWVVVLFGLIACAREVYGVFIQHHVRNTGTLFAFSYVTILYTLMEWGPIEFHGSLFVRAGLLLIFVDKAIAFGYEIVSRRLHWTI